MNELTALATGVLIHHREEGDLLHGRIVMEGNRLLQFTARRGRIKRELQALAFGMPVSVAGPLKTSLARDKEGGTYVLHEMLITSVLTAQPKVPARRADRAWHCQDGGR